MTACATSGGVHAISSGPGPHADVLCFGQNLFHANAAHVQHVDVVKQHRALGPVLKVLSLVGCLHLKPKSGSFPCQILE